MMAPATGGDVVHRAAWLPLLFLGVASHGCSFIVENGTDQCTDNADCAALPGTTCVEGICAQGECSQTQQCVDKYGPYQMCRKVDGACVPLLTKQCTKVEGDYTDDNALVFGSVLPVSTDATGQAE